MLNQLHFRDDSFIILCQISLNFGDSFLDILNDAHKSTGMTLNEVRLNLQQVNLLYVLPYRSVLRIDRPDRLTLPLYRQERP
jgi:hypothetical protein